MANNENILEVSHLKKYYPIKDGMFGRVVGNVKAVDDVSFSIKRGTTMGLVGESGCGKTTVGKTILRLHEITDGSVVFDGTDITKLDSKQMRKFRPRMQLIFQDPYSSLSPRLPVGTIIGEAVKEHHIVPDSEYEDYVSRIMKNCGLQEYHKDRYPHEFSGGQRQRICIARALALNPEFIVCDEPVSALDVSIQAQIINLLGDLQKQYGLTYLFISHDLSVVEHISDTVGVMYLGSIIEYAQHAGAVQCDTHARSYAEDGSHNTGRLDSLPCQPAQGLQVPHALPQLHGDMQEQGSRNARHGRRAFGCLPPVRQCKVISGGQSI